MKAFLLLVFLFLMFLLFASSSLANVNLTNNGSSAAVQGASATSAPEVITIQNNGTNTNPNGANFQVPVTGACSNPYTVQNGDTLSQIAQNCGVTMADLRLANPDITNANLIYPGQQLHIPSAAGVTTGQTNVQTVPQTTPVPVTGGQVAQPTAEVLSNPQVAPIQSSANGAPLIPTGTIVQVRAVNYPPNTPVNIAIGPQATGYNVAAAGITDANGNLLSNITIPSAPDSTTPWVVVVSTTGTPPIQAMSNRFYIGPATTP